MVEDRKRTIFAGIIALTSWMSVYSLEIQEAVTVNKARTQQNWVRFSTDYVRCFCNLPQCVSTGYMCKSSAGGCFSNFSDHIGHSKDYRGRHGCIELIRDKDNRALCETSSDGSSKLHKKKSLICCYHDMCNHIDNPQNKGLLNDSFLGDYSESESASNNLSNLQQPIDYTNSQVWFRAATIAVPVCGAVILFVLIALAVKILRNETENSTRAKLGASNYEPSQSKNGCDYDFVRKHQCFYSDDVQKVQVPLLIQNEISHQSGNKNETNAKLNLMQVNESVVLNIEKVPTKCSKSNFIKHVNNKFVDIKSDDKLCTHS